MKKELINLLKRHRLQFIILAVLLVINTYLYTCPPKYLGIITDLLYNIENNKDLIVQNVLWMLGACLAILVVRLIWKEIEFSLERNMSKTLTEHVFNKFLKIRLEDINSTKNGEIMSYFVRDVKKTVRHIIRFFTGGLRVVVNLIIITIFMAQNSNLQMAVCAVIPVIVTIIALIFIRRKLKVSFLNAQNSFTELSEFVQENTDSIRTTKAFSGEEKEIENFEAKNLKLKKSNIKVSYIESLLDVLINIGLGISYTIALLWGSNLVINGEMTVGNMIAFMGFLTLLDMPIMFLPWIVSRVDDLKISIGRLNKVFNLPEEKITLEVNSRAHKISGNIEIKDLSFHYPNSLENVLSNISVSVNKGETLGIIGVVGSGKTTLMNLLVKLYDVSPGTIFIDGKDINEIDPEIIRNSICYITQDNFLFSASLKENINIFKDEYKDKLIKESTQKAMIYNEIADMKDGIYTIIGEKGIDLSGGQKQRVVISRAFLNNSDIVIFDDTFSALDNKTEQHVLNNIKDLVKDKTCIIVSNRISDIRDCDKIIVLEQGKIVERGNHKSLLNEKGAYYKFYNNQANKVEELM